MEEIKKKKKKKKKTSGDLNWVQQYELTNLVYCLFLAKLVLKLGLKINTFLTLMGTNLISDSYSWVMDSC